MIRQRSQHWSSARSEKDWRLIVLLDLAACQVSCEYLCKLKVVCRSKALNTETCPLYCPEVFYFTIRDALNFGTGEHFGLISTCAAWLVNTLGSGGPMSPHLNSSALKSFPWLTKDVLEFI